MNFEQSLENEPAVLLMLNSLELPDLIQLTRTSKTIRDLLKKEPFSKIYQKQLEDFYEFHQMADDRDLLDMIYQIDPMLEEIGYGKNNQTVASRLRMPVPVQNPTETSVTIRGINWDKIPDKYFLFNPIQNNLKIFVRTKDGVRYPVLMPTGGVKRNLFMDTTNTDKTPTKRMRTLK